MDALADLLFSGLTERPMWAGFLVALSHRLGSDAAGFILQSGEAFLPEAAVLTADTAHAAQHEALLASGALHAMPFDTPLQLSGISGAQRADWLALRIRLDEARSAWLTVPWNEQGAAGWRDVFDALLPLLQRVVRLYIMIGDSERRRRVSEHVLETSGVGIVLVDSMGQVLMANAIARSIMTESNIIAIDRGTLRAKRGNDNQLLQASIRDMAERQSPEADLSCHVSIALERDEQIHPLTLIIRPGPPYAPVTAPLRRSAVVILRDPAQRSVLATPDLIQLFALSRAEARLAGLLADGLSLEEAAAALGVTRNTARSQLQAVFAKTGTKRQGDLVRLLLSSTASMAQKRPDETYPA
ncbi:hypothetical protein MB02_07685 [Croceicoccus estronivorus]|nr:hypothetical protein MB02_07685 [Croceicoccus estronivorus]